MRRLGRLIASLVIVGGLVYFAYQRLRPARPQETFIPPTPPPASPPPPGTTSQPATASAPAPTSSPVPGAPADDLTTIKGIGPVYARGLKELGITTYAQLAAATAEQVTAGMDVRGTANVDSWIAQARDLADG